MIFAIILALLAIFSLATNAATPMDTNELKMHTSNLMLIEQDMSSILSIHNVEIVTAEDGM